MPSDQAALKQASLSHWIAQEPYESKFKRVKQRELTRCSRRNPMYVESLVTAEYLNEKMQAPHFLLSAESLVDMCRFSQRTKWLCPWGEQLYNEIHREPTQSYPMRMCDYYNDIECDGRILLAKKDFKALVDDVSNAWERVVVFDPPCLDWLENLHKHPVEELHIVYECHTDYYAESDSEKVVECIVRCKSLRSLTLWNAEFPTHLHSKLLKLKNIEHIVGTVSPHLSCHIDIYKNLTSLRYLHNYNGYRGPDDRAYFQLLEIVKSRQNTLEHIELEEPPRADYVDALVKCPKLQTFRMLESNNMTDDDMAPFLSHPVTQRQIRDFWMSDSSAGPRTFALLAKFTNLRFLMLQRTNITGKEAAKIMINNKFHMREVSLSYCENVGPEILDAISQCAHLEWVDLSGPHTCTWKGGIAQYIRERRPNYGAIRYT